jgi:hypothetical protein
MAVAVTDTVFSYITSLFLYLHIIRSHNKPKAEVHTGAITLTGPREEDDIVIGVKCV